MREVRSRARVPAEEACACNDVHGRFRSAVERQWLAATAKASCLGRPNEATCTQECAYTWPEAPTGIARPPPVPSSACVCTAPLHSLFQPCPLTVPFAIAVPSALLSHVSSHSAISFPLTVPSAFLSQYHQLFSHSAVSFPLTVPSAFLSQCHQHSYLCLSVT